MTAAETDLALTHLLADAADAIALRHFAAGATTSRAKSDGSPVSAADEQIEHALRTRTLSKRPGDAVLEVEFGATGSSRRRWIIDAIDGTASFLAGEPEWSTLIALEEQGTITLGIAPLVPIIEEAGGTYTDLTTTRDTETFSALFTNHAPCTQILNTASHRF